MNEWWCERQENTELIMPDEMHGIGDGAQHCRLLNPQCSREMEQAPWEQMFWGSCLGKRHVNRSWESQLLFLTLLMSHFLLLCAVTKGVSVFQATG